MPSKRPRRRVREYLPKKEHPVYRQIIISKGWTPYVLCDAKGCYWDGRTVLHADGTMGVSISDPAQEEMIVLAIEGRFGERVKDVFMDYSRYDRSVDDLVTGPNE